MEERDFTEIKPSLRDQAAKFDGVRDRMARNFRILFAAFIATVLVLAGLMVMGFGWL